MMPNARSTNGSSCSFRSAYIAKRAAATKSKNIYLRVAHDPVSADVKMTRFAAISDIGFGARRSGRKHLKNPRYLRGLFYCCALMK